MNLRVLLTRPPKPLDPWLRYGFLAFCLILLGWHLRGMSRHSWAPGRENIGLVLVALLLNHLAFRFPWPSPVMAGLRVLACAWILLAFGYWLWLLQGRTWGG
jgi:hypothetical protein